MKYYGNDKLMIPFFIYEAWKKLLNPPRNHLKKKKIGESGFGKISAAFININIRNG